MWIFDQCKAALAWLDGKALERSQRIALIPVLSGIDTSMTVTSARHCRVSSSVCRPLDASAAITMSGLPETVWGKFLASVRRRLVLRSNMPLDEEVPGLGG
jgi:hypothetical protein